MTSSRRARVLVGVCTLTVAVALTGCASNRKASDTTTAGASGRSAATAASAADLSGMDALVKAAQAEGQLNVITLPRDWANYGELMDNFTKKYGIKITDANPDGSSADELTAIKTLKSQDRAPDVVDVGQAFALSGTKDGLYAPYKVASWSQIPDSLKDAGGNWFNDYGGYVSIGCDTTKVTTCPTTFAQLNNPTYKGKLALNGDPTKANAAFSAVWASALANGGSFDSVKPGIDFFAKLKKAGIYVPIQATAATIESGETPIVLDWDYLNAAKTDALKAKGRNFTVSVPSDGLFSAYYAQAISKYAPHPAAARLWEEYLYSVEGQNGWLKGYARPAEFASMQTEKTADAALAAKLPSVSGTPTFPTNDQTNTAKSTLTQDWASSVK
ncbi:MAG: ABC transporter substrate-binding protein [Actinomycetota bacterium]|nr:ABC transporter substrate-binding protein [Actinomycetota bacterium]MDQ2956096.1 ABC transporter substrate-binding protein [Actinomycetota bacterium]